MAISAGAYTSAAAWLVGRRLGELAAASASLPAVTLLKPLHGAPPGLTEALESFCRQDYAGEVQTVFGVQDPGDPAIGVVRNLRTRHPGVALDLVVDPTRHGTNRKVSNLINMAGRARHDVLVLSDADIEVTSGYLSAIASALAQPGVGVVSCLYVGKGRAGPWSRLAAMAIDYHFLPNAVMGMALGMARPCFGSTIALTAETLGRIGGFEALANHLADDFEIGRRARALGLAIAVPPMLVTHLCAEASVRELIGHELRWGRTVRQIDPAGYAGSAITYPLPLALIAGAFLGFSPIALVLIFAILGVRIAAKARIDRATGAKAGPWFLIPARDVLSFAVFLASFAVNTVGWGGERLRVRRDGVLIHTQGS